MAKVLIGNVKGDKGKDGRGITKIVKTASTGAVDTYTITYTDNTTSTFTINNSDSISLQRQIVPSAAVESSATASQAYAAGDYVVVNGALRKAKAAIAKGNTIGDSNSTATTVTGELATLGDSVSPRHLGGGNVVLLGCTIKVDCWLFATSILIVKFSHVSGEMSSSGACELGSNAAFTLPENLRPKTDIRATAFTSLRFGKSIGALVEPSGAVKLYFSTSARIDGYGFETCSCCIPLAI
nr:MAG TPA: hypothetical protein [Caudoviricetes sp.]